MTAFVFGKLDATLSKGKNERFGLMLNDVWELEDMIICAENVSAVNIFLFTSKASKFVKRRECPLIDTTSVRQRTGLHALRRM
jgi:hypothetical protein